MIIKSMSLSARQELLASVRQKYRDSSWIDKGKILDGFVAATGYNRKHAIQLMNSTHKLRKKLLFKNLSAWWWNRVYLSGGIAKFVLKEKTVKRYEVKWYEKLR